MAFQSLFTTILAAKANSADTTITLAAAPAVTSGRMRIFSDGVSELISYSGVNGTILTGVVRNLPTSGDTSVGGTGLIWPAGTQVVLVAMHDQLPDNSGPITFKAPAGGSFASDALADAAWGGTAPNGAFFYNTSMGRNRVKESGNWVSTTGSVDYATTRACLAAAANNGEFYRDTANSNALTYKSSTGVSYAIVVDATGKLASTAYDFSSDTTGTETTKPVNAAGVKANSVALASDAEAQAGTVTTKSISPAQLAANAAAFVRSAWSTDFSTATRYTASVNGAATNTFDSNGASISGGGTNGNWAKIIYTPGKPFVVGDRMSFTVSNSSSGNNYECYFGIGTVTISGSGHTFTNSHVGFKLLKPAGSFSFSATVANGSTETATVLTTTDFSAAILEASIFYRSASAIEFTYRTSGGSWSSPVTITTNIPSAQTLVQLDALTLSGGGGMLYAFGMGCRS